MSRSPKEEILSLIKNLFVCRTDVWADGYEDPNKPNKYRYVKVEKDGVDVPLTDDIIWQHLKGERQISIYSLMPGGLAHWAAIDFDHGDFLHDAYRQVEKFAEIGLLSYVERSRSGEGAHVWVFFDAPVLAKNLRAVINAHILATDTKDRVYPNAQGNYGNALALPYNGQAYKHGNSAFLNDKREPYHPLDFLRSVQKNSAALVDLLYNKLPAHKQSSTARRQPNLGIRGALKVRHFCAWVNQAAERMPNQNQEPELYSLACQFAQLRDGENIFYQLGRLHPYDDTRIAEKWEQALEKNLPERCETIREKYGDCGKRCDLELNIQSPYELARQSFSKLMSGDEADPEVYGDIIERVESFTQAVYNNEVEPGIAYGWDQVDDLTELRRGDLVIIAAEPSVGKSATMTDLVVNMGRRNIASAIYSLEMPKEQVTQRIWARDSGVDSTAIGKGLLSKGDWEALNEAKQRKLPVFIDDRAASLEQIMDSLADLVAKHNVRVAFIDYIQLVAGENGENERQTIRRVSMGLKAIAKMLNITIVGLSQLNRQAEADQQEDIPPSFRWIAEGATIERAADVVMFLLGRRGGGVLTRHLHFMKERHRGAAGRVIRMNFHSGIFKFECTGGRLAPVLYGADDNGELF